MLQTIPLKYKKPLYGQLVIGPPGSGKTTYCNSANNFFKSLGRKTAIVNLDPANENMEYTADIDIMELITVADVMETMQLGPNGSIMYCAEYLEKHFDNWFLPRLREKGATCNYFIFDCPGQVELYTHHTSMANIFERLINQGDYHLVTVNLIDSHYCSQPTKFISTLLLSLNMMLRMGLPHVNVLSKADLLRKEESKLRFNLDFYTEVMDLKYLLDALTDGSPSMQKYYKLNEAICSMVEDFSLVSYQLLDVHSSDSMLRLRNHIDKASGYIYRAGEEQSVNSLLACAVGVESESTRYSNDIDPYSKDVDMEEK